MGKPSAAESSQLHRMSAIAEKLRNRTANDADRDEAQAIMLEVYVAERRLGLVAVSECDLFRKDVIEKMKAMVGWNVHKSAAVVTSVLAVCGTVAGICIKLF